MSMTTGTIRCNEDDPTLEELKAAWAPHVTTLANLAAAWGKPVLFTEIGYCSQDGANRRPWDWRTGGSVDLQEQANTYQAALESLYSQPWFAGVFWWAWGTDAFEGGAGDAGYTPHDKPAEDVLRNWYAAPGLMPGDKEPSHDPQTPFSQPR